MSGDITFGCLPKSFVMSSLPLSYSQQRGREAVDWLLTYTITNLAFAGEEVPRPSFDRADAIVEVIMRALAS